MLLCTLMVLPGGSPQESLNAQYDMEASVDNIINMLVAELGKVRVGVGVGLEAEQVCGPARGT